MFCKYCGNELPELANFCPKCGKINEDTIKENDNVEAKISNEEATYGANTANVVNEAPVEPVDPFKEEKRELGNNILKFAIMGLAFGLSFYLSVVGIVFSIIARCKVNNYIKRFGHTERQATVGNSLSKAGMAVSISFSVLCTIFMIALIVSVVNSVSGDYGIYTDYVYSMMKF